MAEHRFVCGACSKRGADVRSGFQLVQAAGQDHGLSIGTYIAAQRSISCSPGLCPFGEQPLVLQRLAALVRRIVFGAA